MTALIYIGIGIATIIVTFVIELLIVALYPNVTAQRQNLNIKAKTSAPVRPGRSEQKKNVTFKVDDIPISGWLYLPDDLSIPVPCIIMGNGFGGTKNMLLDEYAMRFREIGLAVLTFDYRFFGESGGQPRQLIWIPYQLQDYAAAVEYVRNIKEINPDKIALWGTSLSGGHVIVTAANDEKIACVSAQVPFLDGTAGYEEQFHRTGVKYMLRMIGHAQRDLVRSWLGLSPHKIPLVGKPGTVALMADEDAWNTFEELAPPDFINEACARIAIRMDKYRPITRAGEIRCPVLLQVCDLDITLPKSLVEKAKIQLGKFAEVINYPIGHFDIYHGENFEKAVNDQLSFFKRHLLN